MFRTEPVPQDQLFKVREKIPTTICTNDLEAAVRVAGIIADTIRRHNKEGKPTVLGLATGHTPIGVYRELIRMHKEEGLDFSNVVTFNLDEYYPMRPDSIQSYRRWMKENFFDHVNIPAAGIHVPDGTLPEKKVAKYCREYEAAIMAAGGLDIQILGVGRTGHIGFNEPGSSRESRTRIISLDRATRMDAASDFFGEGNVPRQAITMGVGTILEAGRVLLMAFGEQKAPIIRKAVEGPVTDAVAASFLQEHPNAEIIVDLAAGADLTRMDTPWLLGEIEWSEEYQARAVIWLSLLTGKSILKLDRDDYDNNHLASLARQSGPVDDLNVRVGRRMWNTLMRQGMLPRDKKVLCFSPHPDDDVISMGGTLHELARSGCEVHVAYMTSGNIAVFDEHARQMLNTWADLNRLFGIDMDKTKQIVRKVKEFFASKSPGAMDIREVLLIKEWIRRNEAAAACRSMGIAFKNAAFLDMPFYQTGEVRKRPIGEEDIKIVHNLLKKIRPQWVFVAGELADPHGTHRLCADAIFNALRRLSKDEQPEEVWLYRGAWQEWDIDMIDMAVPLSKAQLIKKIFGIFKHQSQKDKALFPGPYDDREFWQRAEARNRETAERFNQLGLPEYYAMEAFVRWKP
ncbi:MAG TPA: glucosamine-6-phosphate deaminase [Phycisphaerae bacterium]|nr:glucosamine-6-phosphate deaminase [Phycisphaerae bacterium]